MISDQDKHALKCLLKVALPAVQALPPAERADAYDGIAVACSGVDAEMHTTARQAASLLRDAEGLQLTFRNLITPDHGQA